MTDVTKKEPWNPARARLTPGAYMASSIYGLMQFNFCVEWEVVWKYLHTIPAPRTSFLPSVDGAPMRSEYQRLFPWCERAFGLPRPRGGYFVVPPGVPIAQPPRMIQ